jgi:hypothetical protein
VAKYRSVPTLRRDTNYVTEVGRATERSSQACERKTCGGSRKGCPRIQEFVDSDGASTIRCPNRYARLSRHPRLDYGSRRGRCARDLHSLHSRLVSAGNFACGSGAGRPLSYRHERLSSPARVYFDFQNTVLKAHGESRQAARHDKRERFPSGTVSGCNDTARLYPIVFDLASEISHLYGFGVDQSGAPGGRVPQRHSESRLPRQ